jgi:K+-transporting ATPase ATPase C chain
MLQQLRAAVVSVLVITVLMGLLFPFAIWGIAKVLFPHQANGSLIEQNGAVVGSALIGQNFTAPGYFHPRPSAAGNGYDAANSSGTNLGPTSDKLINGIHKKTADGKDDPGNFDGIKDLADAYRKENNLPPTQDLPSDAVTRSASGLDPEVSPANAALQIGRVAKQRGLSDDQVAKLVNDNTAGRQLGILGEPRVNVLNLNLALDQAAPGKSGMTPAAPAKP